MCNGNIGTRKLRGAQDGLDRRTCVRTTLDGSGGREAIRTVGAGDGPWEARSRLAAVRSAAKPFWGNFETGRAAVWIYPATPHHQIHPGLPPSVFLQFVIPSSVLPACSTKH
jgi:hypothetical protein